MRGWRGTSMPLPTVSPLPPCSSDPTLSATIVVAQRITPRAGPTHGGGAIRSLLGRCRTPGLVSAASRVRTERRTISFDLAADPWMEQTSPLQTPTSCAIWGNSFHERSSRAVHPQALLDPGRLDLPTMWIHAAKSGPNGARHNSRRANRSQRRAQFRLQRSPKVSLHARSATRSLSTTTRPSGPPSWLIPSCRLPNSYRPKDLVPVAQTHLSGGGKVRQVMVRDLTEMVAAARSAGVRLIAHSAYRSYGTQAATFRQWVRGVRLQPSSQDERAARAFGASTGDGDRFSHPFAVG